MLRETTLERPARNPQVEKGGRGGGGAMQGGWLRCGSEVMQFGPRIHRIRWQVEGKVGNGSRQTRSPKSQGEGQAWEKRRKISLPPSPDPHWAYAGWLRGAQEGVQAGGTNSGISRI